MAKRFTATEKWNDKWFRQLPAKYKLLWVYLLDNCDNAGIIEIDLEPAEFYIKAKFDTAEIKTVFGDRICELNGGSNKWFIPKFVSFQYNVLNPDVKAHKSVIDKLNKYNLLNEDYTLKQDLPNSYLTVKDKDKDMVIVKDKAKDKGGDFIQQLIDVFLEAYLKTRHTDHVIVNEGKERKAMGALLGAYKKKNKDADSAKTLNDFSALFYAICSRTYKSEFLNGVSITKISTNLMDYIAEINKNKQTENDWDYIFS